MNGITENTVHISGGEPNGILAVDKPAGMTSHDVVNRVRRLYGTKRVGHAGTLDPDATGLLAVMLGLSTRASDYLMERGKTYEAGLLLGLTTDTEDVSGETLTRSDAIPPAADVLNACAAFTGELRQVPPMYSALKIGGRKLVDLARRGVTVEREPRTVTVYSISAEETGDARRYRLTVSCSKGTYIRTLCADIGKALGCGGVMESLRRTNAGGFTLRDAVTLDILGELSAEERLARLLPPDAVFTEYGELRVGGETALKLRNGVTLDDGGADETLRVYDEDGFIALGERHGGKLRLTVRFR